MIPGLLLLAASAMAGTRGVHTDSPRPADLDGTYAPRRVALVVGIDRYTDPALGDLRYPAKDSQDLARVLSAPDQGGFDLVSQVTGTVTSDSFWSAFEAATSHLQRDDTFVLFIAGHGTLDLSGEGSRLYVMPSDAWLAEPADTGIPLLALEAAVADLPARRRVMVLDTCYSGSGRSALTPSMRERLDSLRGPIPTPLALEASEHEVRLFSAHHNQPAIEDEQLQNGVYTHFFVEALAGGGDVDGDGLVEVLEAHDFARDRTLEYTGGVQVPWVQSTMVGREAIYLAGEPGRRQQAELAIIIGIEALPADALLSVDGQPRGAGPVLPGWRSLEIEPPGMSPVRARVHLEPGEQLDVGRIVQQREARLQLGPGGSFAASNAWVPSWKLLLQGWWLPRDGAGLRPAVGLRGGIGLGEVPELGRFHTGELCASMGWWAGRSLQAGPMIGAGAAWRAPEGHWQLAPVASPGLHLQVSDENSFMALEPMLNLFPAEGGWAAVPELLLGVGLIL
jgi:uncharacterized caspase-like protein